MTMIITMMNMTTWRRERAWRSGGRGRRERIVKRRVERHQGSRVDRLKGPTRSQISQKGQISQISQTKKETEITRKEEIKRKEATAKTKEKERKRARIKARGKTQVK